MPGLLRRKSYPVAAPTDLRSHPYIRGMNIQLYDEQTAALIRELSDIVEKFQIPIFAAYPDAARDPR